MKTLTALALALATIAVASAQTFIEFDDAPEGAFDPITSYAGFTLTDSAIVTQSDYADVYGNTYNFPSQPKAIFNGFGVQETSFALPGGSFDFVSGFFAGFGEDDQPFDQSSSDKTSSSVTLRGFSGANLVGSQTYTIFADGFRQVTPNFVGIDRLTISNDGNARSFWVADSFKVTNVVPEPASMAVLGLGLAALKRRRKS